MAISVSLVFDEIADEFVNRVVQKSKEVKVLPGYVDGGDMGPVISKSALDKMHSILSETESQGSKIALDGRSIKVPGYENGYYLGPTVVDHVKQNMTIYTEEVFGPVLAVVRVKTFQEALDVIRSNQYGNGTAIFTSNGKAARDFVRGVEIGMIGINVPIPVPVAYHSFGGWKDSHFGESHIYGPHAIKFYTNEKHITQRWVESDARDATFNFGSRE
jgi:malonate-semialdehyde dehydrogenase (acetylating)/methylmalonate-semialdehyde dehydrogenase